ncbi:2f40b652-730d-4a1a-8437-5bba2f4a4b26 [Thermothielavioides terrestris]|uniref:2f40b652-730d-4a1a-8437-5bba2f4a4b26 n=1 Tax=Thermothielavioides terrestris TaxID=2587410 RepID=A0A3S4BMG7_9PEZI|nr:2f40b652-730d-4a1a-8437-5bba2f4a4b26 [Thermothielavioides terrestris]
MSTITDAPGLPADMLEQWRHELRRVELPINGVSFTHVYCRYAALWAAKFILAELAAASESAAGRSLVYVVPHAAAVKIATDFLQEDGFAVRESLRVMSYSDLNVSLSNNALPRFMAAAIILIDTDFGSLPPQLTVSCARLVATWATRKARNEPLSCAMLVLAPFRFVRNVPSPFWEPSRIARTFGKEVADLWLGPPPRVELQLCDSAGESPADRLAEAISPAVVKKESSAVICLVPPSEGQAIRTLLASKDDVSPFVLTPANFAAQWPAVKTAQEKGTGVVALLVDPALRFLPVVTGSCHYIVPSTRACLALDADIFQPVDDQRPWCADDIDLAVSLGQGARAERSKVFLVSTSRHSPEAVRSATDYGPPPPPWVAWAAGFPEALLCLIGQLDDSRVNLGSLYVGLPRDQAFLEETLRRLRMTKLVTTASPSGSTSAVPSRYRKVALAHSRARQAASFLESGFAETLPEALLLAEVVEAPSATVKLTLAAVASTVRVGISNIVKRGPNTAQRLTLEQCQSACTGIGAQLGLQGRLWIALDLLAADADGSDQLLEVAQPHREEFHRRFRSILDQTAPTIASSPLPKRLTDKEIIAVETAIVRAWLQNLCVTVTTDAEIGDAFQPVIFRRILYFASGGWGTGLKAARRLHFAVHFGLAKVGGAHRTDTLTLVSSEAVVSILGELFPEAVGVKRPNYGILLHTSHA